MSLARTSLCLLSILGTLATLGCKSETDDKYPIALAFGTPPSGLYEMHVGVEIGMVRRDSPKLGNKQVQLWDKWVDEHFTLKDASGQKVKLSRANNSRLMPTNKIAGTFEFFLTAPIKKGTDYELVFQPITTESGKYRHKFTAPEGPADPLRTWFDPVGKK